MLTIITSTLNSDKTILRCFKSISPLSKIITQYIIVDGGSSDSTLKKIRSLSNNLINIEFYILKKSSIFEAWNYGIKKTKNDFILFLGSDDELITKNFIEVEKYLKIQDKTYDLFHFGLKKINYKNNKIIEIRNTKKSEQIYDECIPRIPPNPSTIYRKKLFHKIGFFNTSYKFSSDAEFYFRSKKYNISSININKAIINFYTGGVTNRKNTRLRRSIEKFRLMIKFHFSILNLLRGFISITKSLIKNG